MTKARQYQVDLEATPYYHCVSRCVRRAFLCGHDRSTGQNFEHRRQWIEDRILAMGRVFAIEICAYSVMSNHYHVVLHVNKARAESWTDREVIERWHRLYKGSPLTQRLVRGDQLTQAELNVVATLVESWRMRLYNISQFMQLVNEGIAREANAEDKCTGRFWEGRYKSQALLDDAALMACLAYVDLNPVRAKIATTPEKSAHTSVKRRIQRAENANSPNHPNQQDSMLYGFTGNPRGGEHEKLPFRLTDYLQLVDWTGRQLRPKKRGVISSDIPEIVQRLNIEPKHWLYCASQFESRFKGWVGRYQSLRATAESLSMMRMPGASNCKVLLG